MSGLLDDLEGLSLRNRLLHLFDALLPSANAAKVCRREHALCMWMMSFAFLRRGPLLPLRISSASGPPCSLRSASPTN